MSGSDKTFSSQRQDILESATRRPRVSDKRNVLWSIREHSDKSPFRHHLIFYLLHIYRNRCQKQDKGRYLLNAVREDK